MSEPITPGQFHRAEGVQDWRAVFNGAGAWFRTPTFGTGLALARAIETVATAQDRYPDVDLRGEGVAVRLGDSQGLAIADIELARQISAAARELGLIADPAAVQAVQISIDAIAAPEVMPFWRAVLGYAEFGDEDLVDPRRQGPPLWFQQMDGDRPQRNRVHVDVFVPHDQAEQRVATALAAGGRLISDEYAPAWWTLADAEGNEVDIATWMGRDE